LARKRTKYDLARTKRYTVVKAVAPAGFEFEGPKENSSHYK